MIASNVLLDVLWSHVVCMPIATCSIGVIIVCCLQAGAARLDHAKQLAEFLQWHYTRLLQGSNSLFQRSAERKNETTSPPAQSSRACNTVIPLLQAKAAYYNPNISSTAGSNTGFEVKEHITWEQPGFECGLYTAMNADYISVGRQFDFNKADACSGWMRKEFFVRLLNRKWPWPTSPVSDLELS